MLKALFFKEWLKIRWISFAILISFLLVLLYIFLDASYYMRFMKPTLFWFRVIFQDLQFYGGILVYLPALSGILVGIAQFIPEINSNRLKLTLHLPLKENMILLSMILFGSVALFIIYLISYLILSIIILYFFPAEVLYSAWITTLPWCIAGFLCYWSVSMICVETTWSYRIPYILLSVSFANALLSTQWYNSYINSYYIFIVISLLFIFLTFLSGNRFRKGVM